MWQKWTIHCCDNKATKFEISRSARRVASPCCSCCCGRSCSLFELFEQLSPPDRPQVLVAGLLDVTCRKVLGRFCSWSSCRHCFQWAGHFRVNGGILDDFLDFFERVAIREERLEFTETQTLVVLNKKFEINPIMNCYFEFHKSWKALTIGVKSLDEASDELNELDIGVQIRNRQLVWPLWFMLIFSFKNNEKKNEINLRLIWHFFLFCCFRTRSWNSGISKLNNFFWKEIWIDSSSSRIGDEHVNWQWVR